MLQLAWVSCACVALFFSLMGWGWLALSALGLRRRDDLGLAAAVGMALMCSIGGVLNYFHMVSPAVVLTIFAAGLAAVVVRAAREFTRLRDVFSSAIVEAVARHILDDRCSDLGAVSRQFFRHTTHAQTGLSGCHCRCYSAAAAF